jgi:hypothetical protein
MAQRWNDSRKQRDLEISGELLLGIQPKLKLMPVPELLHCIKACQTNEPSGVDGVSYWLYVEGNHAILQELKQRPVGDLQYLKKFEADPTFIFESDQGPNPTLGTLCGEVLYERRVAR